MKQKPIIVLFATLLLLLVCGLAYFQMHQHQAHQTVYHGAMSAEVKQKYLKAGIDCQETYETQGYESPETIFRMFSLSQHDFYNLNPGTGMDFPAGMVICVKGIWGVDSTPASGGMAWFWPAVAVAAALAGFLAATLYNSHTSKHYHAHAHAHAAPVPHAAQTGDATV